MAKPMGIVSYINKMNRLYGSEQQVASLPYGSSQTYGAPEELSPIPNWRDLIREEGVQVGPQVKAPRSKQQVAGLSESFPGTFTSYNDAVSGGFQGTMEEWIQQQSIPQIDRPFTGKAGGPVYNTRKYFKPGGLVEPGVTHYGKKTSFLLPFDPNSPATPWRVRAVEVVRDGKIIREAVDERFKFKKDAEALAKTIKKTKTGPSSVLAHRISDRKAAEIRKTLPEGVRLNKTPYGWKLTAEIYKGDIKRFGKAFSNPDSEKIKQLVAEHKMEYKKYYPNTLSDDTFEKIRLKKKYKNLTSVEFANELNKLGYNTPKDLKFTKKHVDRLQAKLNLVGEVGEKITPLTKTQQNTLINAFPEYAKQWDFKANKYGLQFSEVGKDVWHTLKATADNTKRWPTGATSKSRLWHNAYRAALKGGDEGRFRILHPKDGAIMSRDEILKYNWTKGSSKVEFLDTKTNKTFNYDGFEKWMNEDAVPGQADDNRFKNAANQYDLNKKLRQTQIGDKTFGNLLSEKFKGRTKQHKFSGLVNHHIYDIADNFWDTDIVFFNDNIGVAKFEKGVRAELKAIANLPKAEQTKPLKELNKKFKNIGPIRMVEDDLTIGSYDQKKMIKHVGKQANIESKQVAKILSKFFRCGQANGISCDDPKAYIKSINEQKKLALAGDAKAAAKFNKVSKAANAARGISKFTLWGILGEVAFAPVIALPMLAKGESWSRIMNDISWGAFGESEKEELARVAGTAGAAQMKTLETSERAQKLQEKTFPGARIGMDPKRFDLAQ